MTLNPWLITNLVPRSLVDEAKGEIWSNPICSRDCLSGMWQAFHERAHAQNKSSKSRPFFDVLSDKTWLYAHLKYESTYLLLLLFLCNTKFNTTVSLNLIIIAR